jgi:hypothetical protein
MSRREMPRWGSSHPQAVYSVTRRETAEHPGSRSISRSLAQRVCELWDMCLVCLPNDPADVKASGHHVIHLVLTWLNI